MSVCRNLLAMSVLGVAGLLVGGSSAPAAAITVNNPSFEDAGAGVPSWGATGGSGTGVYAPIVPGTFGSLPNGTQVAYVYNNGARIYQQTAEPLTPGRIYTFSVFLGERNDTFQPRTWVSILPASELADYLADPVGAGTEYLTITQVEPADVESASFAQFSAVFDTTLPANAALVSAYAGQNLVISVHAVANGETDVDHVSFSYTEVPEPAALSLLGLGAFTLVARCRR